MNPALVEAVRRRMRERPTDELLELWVTNDRAMYSPEAFEAVQALLAERGVAPLPPQNDPAPLAARHAPAADPSVQYGFSWLRPLLWITIVLASLDLAQQAVAAWGVWARGGGAAFRWGGPVDVVAGVVTTLLLPAGLIAASIGCLWRRPTARVLLLLCAWVAVLATAANTARVVAGQSWPRHLLQVPDAMLNLLMVVAHAAHGLVLPVLLVLFLRRPEVRAAFATAGAPGFEPSLSGPTGAPPTAPEGTPPNPASPAGSSSPAARY